MIKKSLAVFALVLLLHILIRDVIKPDIEITQAPWQANQQIGQRYLYSTDTIDNIIVGSSLTYHLNFEGTKEQITNISFSGESAHKGIGLTIARGKLQGLYPKRIYIEINTLDNYAISTFDETIYNPFLSTQIRSSIKRWQTAFSVDSNFIRKICDSTYYSSSI